MLLTQHTATRKHDAIPPAKRATAISQNHTLPSCIHTSTHPHHAMIHSSKRIMSSLPQRVYKLCDVDFPMPPAPISSSLSSSIFTTTSPARHHQPSTPDSPSTDLFPRNMPGTCLKHGPYKGKSCWFCVKAKRPCKLTLTQPTSASMSRRPRQRVQPGSEHAHGSYQAEPTGNGLPRPEANPSPAPKPKPKPSSPPPSPARM
ncbi:hypothetical protein BD289DRAFT_510169 [Coniella lustricola]|uniref:Uncharacterized protein n=1 Tax=Coniella lustricola TaxID=2025994 RepID=A0A2T2ZRX6_9PEZI|nr:hypothetical protein BD289DRAFT_510169 [Coniella lustricola]